MLIPVGFANVVALFQVTGDSELMQTSLGVDHSTFGTDPTEIAQRVWTSFMSELGGGMSTEIELVSVDVVVGQDGGDPITTNVPMGISGLDGDFPLPPNTALLIKKSTGTGGRRGRGRMFIPGFSLFGQIDPAGVIGSTRLGELQTATTDWYEGLLDDTVDPALPPVLFHATAPFTPSPILTLSVDSKVATQRRRLRP